MFIRKNHTGKFKGWNKWLKWNNIIDLQIYVWTKYNWKMDCYMYFNPHKNLLGIYNSRRIEDIPLKSAEDLLNLKLIWDQSLNHKV